MSPPTRADDVAIDQPEPGTHSFVVKVWVEEVALERQEVTWRGHITHVFSGTRRYLKNLGDVSAFIAPYLEAMGVKPRRSPLAAWLRRWRQPPGTP